MEKEQAKEKLKELIKDFSDGQKYWDSKPEADIKHQFIEPLFEQVLGWSRKDVLMESRVLKGRADYILKRGNQELLVVEAKKTNVSLTEDEGRQAVSYAYHRKIKFAVLTNFKSLRVYHALSNIKNIDKNLLKIEGKYFRLDFNEFLDRFDVLWLLSKESFEKQEINKLLSSKDEKINKPIDKSILEDLLKIREWLSKELKSKKNYLSQEVIDEIVQNLIDRLIFIRSVEDRGLEPLYYLKSLEADVRQQGTKLQLFPYLLEKFKDFNNKYDSKLFEPNLLEKEGVFSDDILRKVILALYSGIEGTQDKYMFDIIPGDLLGSIYEQYLGTILSGTEKRVKLEEGTGKRKKMGIYYTPSYIVDYIVKNTIGEYIKDKSIDEILKVKIVDPACGSGSFLVRAFQEVCDKIEEKLKSGEKGSKILFKDYKDKLNLGQKIDILLNCIHGVDLDEKAVELARLNLLLKLLENEGQETKKLILPHLEKNIKNGNSLIDDAKIAGDKAFNWKAQFPDVFRQGGFDVVVGNPPYVNVENIQEKQRNYLLENYLLVKGRFDLYVAFMEKVLSILKENGKFSFIIPFPFTYERYAEKMRENLIDNYTINELLDLSKNKIFEEAIVRNLIFIITKTKKKQNKVKITNLNLKDNSFFTFSDNLTQESFKNNPNSSFRLDVNNNRLDLQNKILKNSIRLGDIFYVNWGLRTGNIKKYVTKNNNLPLTKKMINGKNVKRYYLDYTNDFVIYDKKKLYNPMFEELFENSKLFVPDISGNKGIRSTLDEDNYYAEHTVSVVVRKDRIKNAKRNNKFVIEQDLDFSLIEKFDEKYLLALINSKLINFFFLSRIGGGLHVYPEDIKQLPINLPSPSQEKKIIDLVNEMLSLQKQYHDEKISGGEKERLGQQIKNIDYEINEEVYKLYGITDEEKKIIEGGGK